MNMNEPGQLSGFFTIEVQKPSRKVAWLFGLLVGLGISYMGIGGLINLLNGQTQYFGSFEILLLILFLFFGPLIVLRGLILIFKKSGVYLDGLRMTESGFETGSMTVKRNSIEPKNQWEKSYAGKIQSMNWRIKKSLVGDPLNLIVFLKESRNTSNQLFFERFTVASDKRVLFQLRGNKGANEQNSNNLIAVKNGEFQLLGGRSEVDYHTIIPSLRRISCVLSTFGSGKKVTCTLDIVAKTVDMTPLGLGLGAIGALIGSAADASEKKNLRKRLQDGRKFDSKFTEDLMGFVDEAGWGITVGGEETKLS